MRGTTLLLMLTVVVPAIGQEFSQVTDWRTLYREGITLAYNYDYEEAIVAFERAHALNPTEPLVHWQWAKTLWLKERRDLKNERVRRDDDGFRFDYTEAPHRERERVFLHVVQEGKSLTEKLDDQRKQQFLLGALAGTRGVWVGDLAGHYREAKTHMDIMRKELADFENERQRGNYLPFGPEAIAYLGATNMALWYQAETSWKAWLAFKVAGIPYDGSLGLQQIRAAAEHEQWSQDGSFGLLQALLKRTAVKPNAQESSTAIELADRLRAQYPRNPILWKDSVILALRWARFADTQEERVQRYQRAAELQQGMKTLFANDPRPIAGVLAGD